MEYRLSELRSFLRSCEYPYNIINKGIHNARIQGPAPRKTLRDNLIPYVHPNMCNFEFKNIIYTASNLLQNAKSDTIRHIFKDIRFVEGISQPKNILRTLMSSPRYEFDNAQTNDKPGIFAECTDPRCRICKPGYIQDCNSFMTSNGETW